MMLNIRNMESERCKEVVKNELTKLGLTYKTVELGQVELNDTLPKSKIQLVDIALKNVGLELIADKKTRIIEKIKDTIHQLIYFSDDLTKQNYPDLISKNINYDYTYLSNLFSGSEGITIEKYIIEHKIERVKELLVYDKLSLINIAYKLQYSSVAHLSNQFKKVTGLTPSFFRQLRNISRQKTKNT